MPGLNRSELVVLLLIVAVLITLAVPWLMHSREDARTIQCRANLRNIGLAFNEYADSQGLQFPYGTIVNANLPPERRLAWTLWTSAYHVARQQKSETATFPPFDHKAAWDVPQNKSPAAGPDGTPSLYLRYALFHCPADPNSSPHDQLQHSSYVGMAGIGNDAVTSLKITPQTGIWGYDRQTRFAAIADGLQFTICVIDTPQNNGPWIAGGLPTLRGLQIDKPPYLGVGGQFGGHHAGGAQILFADGHVKLFSSKADPAAFSRLCTIAGK